MGPPPLLVAGLALTYAGSDGSALRMTVDLAQPRPVALQWGAMTRTSSAALRHAFSGLPVPAEGGVEYVLKAGSEVIARRVGPVRASPLRLGVLGDGGPGDGPRSVLLDRLRAADLHAVIALGDPLGWSSEDVDRRTLARSLTAGRPVVLAGLTAATAPTVDDPVRDRLGLPPHVYHLRLGETLLWVLDASLGFDGAQARFVRETNATYASARWRVMVVPDGPLSSGPRGGRASPALWALVDGLAVDVVLSGQDRIYERLRRGRTTVLVSGASGAQVDPRRRVPDETEALVSTPHWVRLTLGARGQLDAYGLEGALIDRAPLPAAPGASRPVRWWRLIGAMGVLVLGLMGVAVGLLRVGTGPG